MLVAMKDPAYQETHGRPVAVLVAESKCLQLVLQFVTMGGPTVVEEAFVAVQESACRAVCTITANQPLSKQLVCQTAPNVVRQLLAYVQWAADALPGAQAARGAGEDPVEALRVAFSSDCVVGEAHTMPVFLGAEVGPAPGAAHKVTVFSRAAGALWALSALVAHNTPVQRALALDSGSIAALMTLMRGQGFGPVQEACLGSAWLVQNLVWETEAKWRQRVAAVPGLVPCLLDVVRYPVSAHWWEAQGLGAWALRSLMWRCPENRQLVADLGGVAALHSLLTTIPALVHTVPRAASVQATAVWVLGDLCQDSPDTKDLVGEAGLVGHVVAAMTPGPSAHLRMRAAETVYSMVVRHPANQARVADAGGLELLLGILQEASGAAGATGAGFGVRPWRNGLSTPESVLASMLATVMKHPVNQGRLAHAEGFVEALCYQVQNNTLPRVQGLAAGLVRVLAADCPDVQARLGAHGAVEGLVGALEEARAHCDAFGQEQAAGALFNLMVKDNTANLDRALAAHAHLALARCLQPRHSVDGHGAPAPAPSTLAKTFTVMCLLLLANYNAAAVMPAAVGTPGLYATLCAMADPHFVSDDKLLAHARRLVGVLEAAMGLVATDKTRADAVADLVLGSLRPVDGVAKELHTCCICVGTGPVGAPAAAPAPATDNLTHAPSDAPAVNLPCTHYFHVACIRSWVVHNDTCPLCARPVLATIYKGAM